jgi:hypothetical protein
MPLFGEWIKLFDVCTWFESGKAGKVKRSQLSNFFIWCMSGEVNSSYLAVRLAATWTSYFVVWVLRELFIRAHKNPMLSR